MKNIWTIAKYTIKEALSRKIMLTFFAVSTFGIFIILIAALAVGSDSLFEFFKTSPGDDSLTARISEALQSGLIIYLFGGGLFLSIFSVSSFIPNMLERGTIDLLLSKPIERFEIILGKYLGGIVIVFANILYAVLCLWLIIGFKLDQWNFYFLLTSFSITFTFMVLYAMIIFTGVLTRSSILAMMVSYFIFFILSPMLVGRETLASLFDSNALLSVLTFFYYIIPQTADLGEICTALATGRFEFSFTPVFVSLGFIILNLAGCIFIFNKKDY